MKQLLELIENANPDDRDGLDEIDARAWCYINGGNLIKVNSPFSFTSGISGVEYDWGTEYFKKYTRSRDELKAVRPEGWLFSMDFSVSGYDCHGYQGHDSLDSNAMSYNHPTEELAELHAIIQAIEWERREK